MAFSEQKLIDLNIYHYIKESVLFSSDSLDISFDEEVIDDEMTAIEVIRFNIKKEEHRAYKATNRNWIYYASLDITIKKNGFEINSSNYSIDYLNGIIIFDESFANTLDDADLITASYTYLQVEVLDGYPYSKLEESDFQNNLPVVAVEYMDGSETPYELGGTVEAVRSFTIHVLGVSASERDDLTGIIKKGLKYSIPITDYREGMPLNFDGTKNADFQAIILDAGMILFENVRDKVVRLNNPLPSQRHWSMITFNTRSFV